LGPDDKPAGSGPEIQAYFDKQWFDKSQIWS